MGDAKLKPRAGKGTRYSRIPQRRVVGLSPVSYPITNSSKVRPFPTALAILRDLKLKKNNTHGADRSLMHGVVQRRGRDESTPYIVRMGSGMAPKSLSRTGKYSFCRGTLPIPLGSHVSYGTPSPVIKPAASRGYTRSSASRRFGR